MALAANEVWSDGFVTDAATGARVTTTDASAATQRNGFLRDPDGRLVVRL